MMSTSPILALAPRTPRQRDQKLLASLQLDGLSPRQLCQNIRDSYSVIPTLSEPSAYIICGIFAALAFTSPIIATVLGSATSYAFRTRNDQHPTLLSRQIRAAQRFQARVSCTAMGLSLLVGTLGALAFNGRTPDTLLVNESAVAPAARQLHSFWHTTLSPQVVAPKLNAAVHQFLQN